MGVSIRTDAICICKKNDEMNGEKMIIVGQLTDKSHIEYILRCPMCGKKINVSVKLTYTDSFNGVRVW
jgi:hypothetical protein